MLKKGDKVVINTKLLPNGLKEGVGEIGTVISYDEYDSCYGIEIGYLSGLTLYFTEDHLDPIKNEHIIKYSYKTLFALTLLFVAFAVIGIFWHNDVMFWVFNTMFWLEKLISKRYRYIT
jgi:hypothetical protein